MGSCSNKHRGTEEVIKIETLKKTSIPYVSRIDNILDNYIFTETVGYGSFGKVRKAKVRNVTNLEVAIKTIDKRKFPKELYLETFKRELEILMSVDHPNIIKFIESFEGKRYIHIVTEYCSGGDLSSAMADSQFSRRGNIVETAQKVLRAVHHLHLSGICHRDIKPENFLFSNSELKLIDFGLSRKFSAQELTFHTLAGSPYYLAPEIAKGDGYNFKCDM